MRAKAMRAKAIRAKAVRAKAMRAKAIAIWDWGGSLGYHWGITGDLQGLADVHIDIYIHIYIYIFCFCLSVPILAQGEHDSRARGKRP
jgi:hypothetical protein